MRKTNRILVVKFEKLDFFSDYLSNIWLYNTNIEQISNSKC